MMLRWTGLIQVTEKTEETHSLPNLLDCPLLTEYIKNHISLNGTQMKYLVNMQLHLNKSKEEILEYFKPISGMDNDKIVEIIDSSINASKVGMLAHIKCFQFRNAFGYTEDDCRTTDCKYKPEADSDENKTESCLIKLEYPTNHLLGFDDLSTATELSGNEYIII